MTNERQDKRLYFGTNLKMYKTAADARVYIQALVDRLTGLMQTEPLTLFALPSYTSLPFMRDITQDSPFRFGAQNMSWLDKGEHTGEISANMLAECGVHIVQVGHSERRNTFAETNEMIRQKVYRGLHHGFTVLLCVGEHSADKDEGTGDCFLTEQLCSALDGVDAQAAARLWIAYEPVWAIGVNGIPADPGYVDERHNHIRAVLVEQYGEAGRDIPIFFGGSVNETNAAQYIALDNVDGLFVGRAAWTPEGFETLLKLVLPVWKAKNRT